MECLKVILRLKDGDLLDARLDLEFNATAKITLVGLMDYEFSGLGGDYFDALIDLRISLEKKDVYILCNGSRRDVFPSGMSRSMSNGRKAYILEMGKAPLFSSIVDIFSYDGTVIVATVEEQNEFYKKWVDSLMP